MATRCASWAPSPTYSEKVLAEEERDRLFNLSVDMLAVGGFDGSFQPTEPRLGAGAGLVAGRHPG